MCRPGKMQAAAAAAVVAAAEAADGVLSLLDNLVLKPAAWESYVHLSPENYTRTLVALEQSFSVVLICWNAGQASPIHDHGAGKRTVLNLSLPFLAFSLPFQFLTC